MPTVVFSVWRGSNGLAPYKPIIIVARSTCVQSSILLLQYEINSSSGFFLSLSICLSVCDSGPLSQRAAVAKVRYRKDQY